MKTSRTPPPPDPNEPANVAEAIASWGLDYIVITSVDRDDLPDQGSGHFTETVQKLKTLKPHILIEALSKRSFSEYLVNFLPRPEPPKAVNIYMASDFVYFFAFVLDLICKTVYKISIKLLQSG